MLPVSDDDEEESIKRQAENFNKFFGKDGSETF